MSKIKITVPSLEDSVSIHPRVIKGKTRHEKVNTAKAPKRTTKAQKNLHTRQNVWDRTKTAGTRRPGSNKK